MPRYRRWQLWALEKNPLNMEYILGSIGESAAFVRRDGGGGWTISEVIGHLIDVDSAFLARARAIIAGEAPPPGTGRTQDEMVLDAGYAEQDALELLQRWQALRMEYREILASVALDDEELWQRPQTGASRSFTLNDQLVLSAYHDVDHIHQVVKIIRGR